MEMTGKGGFGMVFAAVDAAQKVRAQLVVVADQCVHLALPLFFFPLFPSSSCSSLSLRAQCQVAIKRMPHATDRDKKSNLREIWFLNECKHPNIVSFYAAYVVGRGGRVSILFFFFFLSFFFSFLKNEDARVHFATR